jgi:LytS/YehU family sensor histidine kinase
MRTPGLFVVAFVGPLISIVLGMICVMFMCQLNKPRQNVSVSKRINELEMKVLRSQMNPHFLFNVLNSIQYCIVSGNYHSANMYLSKFSKLLRNILENSDYLYCSIQQEIEILTLYVELEKLRFDNDLSFHMQIEDGLPLSDIFIPSMLLQPYVENALLHGLLNKDMDRKLEIRFRKMHHSLVIEIEDNGIGRQLSQLLKLQNAPERKSFGLRLSADRLKIMNAYIGHKALIETEDLYSMSGQPTGTRVKIKIPLNQGSI